MTIVEASKGGAGFPQANAFANVTMLFFAWGFITAAIDPLIPVVRSVFSLSYAESMLTQFAFFMAYGLVSLPAALFVSRAGYANSTLFALAAMIAGCLLMPVATAADSYEIVLVALFVIASGITLLQVAANPLAAALGDPKRSHFRLTLSQAFNSLGTVAAPLLGAILLLRGGVFAEGADHSVSRGETLSSVALSFSLIAGFVAVLAAAMWRAKARISKASAHICAGAVSPLRAFSSPWALAGAAAIFLYVGAEVSIGSIMINLLADPEILGASEETAGRLLSLYWGGAMIGRFIGSAALTKAPAALILCAAGVGATLLCFTVFVSGGVMAAVAALAIGLFNAIMFPTIFTLTLQRSDAPTSAVSGLLCMAIVGGAIIPLLTGVAADRAGLSASFLIPLAAYCAISFFAFLCARVDMNERALATREIRAKG